MFMGFSYARNKKSTTYFCIAILAIALVVHSIVSFSALESVVDGSSYVKYLAFSYNEMTIFGSLGSILCGLLAMILGAMGSIVVFGIIATLFAGLFVDYNFFGKFEPSVKKLKGYKLRQKVQNSDIKRTADNSPPLSFSDEKSNVDVVDEIIVSEDELKLTTQNGEFRGYNFEDEIASTEEDVFEPLDPIEKQQEYIDIYSKEDAYVRGKKFMDDTMGKFETEDSQNIGFSFENEENNFNQKEEPSEDDFSKLFSGSDDDINEPEVETSYNPISDNYFNKSTDSAELNNNSNNNIATDFSTKINNYTQRNNSGFSDTTGIHSINVSTPSDFMRQQEERKIIKSKRPTEQTGIPGIRYNPPPLSLLKNPTPDKGDYSEEQRRKSLQLENVLAAFNVPAKVQKIVRGPKITRFELSVPLGISIKSIPKHEDDIAAALMAKTIVIRAPIPGSSHAGIELENETFTSVLERELLESPEFQNAKDPLPIAIGKDISGEIIVKSLPKLVHLLIAGSTNSGKSVFIHNIVLSLIYKNSPDDLKLIMIDPKRVEFNRYNGLPHLITPEVVMGSEKAINALKWCVKEMERRYELMSKSGHNNIEQYNKSELVKAGQFAKMPYIVVIVDELAEIMSVNKKEVELCIQRITQLARACGMHLIVATQRPSVDIISGVIKNNIPSRVAFSLQSGIDSKTILNTVGAEKLLGQGDMLFSPTGTSTMPRLQGAWASNDEIESVINYVKKYNKVCYDESIQEEFDRDSSIEESSSAGSDFGGGFDDAPRKVATDSLFKVAVKLVMANNGASTSFLQRRLSIGFARAGKIIDQMSDKGFIGPPNGSKPRSIIITPEMFYNEFGEDYNSIN